MWAFVDAAALADHNGCEGVWAGVVDMLNFGYTSSQWWLLLTDHHMYTCMHGCGSQQPEVAALPPPNPPPS
eukprot:1392368-Amphidinium_carterae.1